MELAVGSGEATEILRLGELQVAHWCLACDFLGDLILPNLAVEIWVVFNRKLQITDLASRIVISVNEVIK